MRAIGRWSVASFLSVALGFIQLGLVVGLIVTVVATGTLPLQSTRTVALTLPVSFSLDSPAPVRLGRSGFGFEILNEKEAATQDAKGKVFSTDGSVRILTTNKWLIAANASAFVLVLAFALYIVGQLRAVLRSLIHGNPFVPDNARRLRRVALAVLIGEFVRAAIVYAENLYAATHVTAAGVMFDTWPRLDVGTLGHGLIILVIAEVFRVGTRLDEEQALTI